jgi:hypothetical protein
VFTQNSSAFPMQTPKHYWSRRLSLGLRVAPLVSFVPHDLSSSQNNGEAETLALALESKATLTCSMNPLPGSKPISPASHSPECSAFCFGRVSVDELRHLRPKSPVCATTPDSSSRPR